MQLNQQYPQEFTKQHMQTHKNRYFNVLINRLILNSTKVMKNNLLKR